MYFHEADTMHDGNLFKASSSFPLQNKVDKMNMNNMNPSNMSNLMEENGRRLDRSATTDRGPSTDLRRLQTRNKELESQIESLKENTIVQSMNDMKESYKLLIKENVELREKLSKLEESNLQKELDEVKKRANIYSKIIRKLESKSRKVLTVAESIEKAIREGGNGDGDIEMPEMMLDGIFLVMQSANEMLENYIGHEIIHDLDCSKGKCGGCYQCHNSRDEDLLFDR